MKISLFLILAFINLHSAFAENPSIEEHWNKSSINFSFISDRLLNSEKCFSSESQFLGCVAAMNILLNSDREKNSKTKLVLLTANHTVSPQEVREMYGKLVIVEKKLSAASAEANSDVVASFKAEKAEQQKEEKIWLNVFTDKSISPQAFIDLADLKLSMTKSKSEAMTAGLMYNSYLSHTFDPHTYIMPRSYFDEMQDSNGQRFVGVGVMIVAHTSGLFVKNVIASGPAEEVGMQNLDIITEVNNTSLVGVSFDEATKLLRGPEGSKVQLKVLRAGKTLPFEISRRTIIVKNVNGKKIMLAGTNQHQVGYISVSGFLTNDTCETFAGYAEDYQTDEKVDGIIVDLRGNGGGSIDIANCMLSIFIAPGRTIITSRNPATNEVLETLLSVSSNYFISKPLVVLVDGNSASASELFSGVVQDYNLGFIVGARTFGKGTMQSISINREMKNIVNAKTIARFHLPSGRTNQLTGILPDFEAYSRPNPKPEDKFFIREEDQYSNAISTVQSAYSSTHPLYKSTQSCMQKSSAARSSWSDGQDYTLLVGEDVIRCSLPEMNLATN